MQPELEPSVPPTISVDQLINRSIHATPHDVQMAINGLEPHTETAAQDAELIYGVALGGLRLNPHDEDWASVEERAAKILNREM